MKHCTICHQDVTTVGQVRGCSQCHQNGTAAGMHAVHQDSDPIEDAIARSDPGALPFVDMRPETVAGPEPTPAPRLPAKEGVVAKVKRAYHRVAGKASKKKK